MLCMLCAVVWGNMLQAQTIEHNAFKQDFRAAFEQSIGGFDIKAEAPALNGATQTTIVEDKEQGSTSWKVEYRVAGRDEAKKLKEQLAVLVEGALPPGDYKKTQGYGADYFDYLKYTFEFNSEVYAEVNKRPAIEIGALKEGDAYVVVLLLRQPYFPGQYTVKW